MAKGDLHVTVDHDIDQITIFEEGDTYTFNAPEVPETNECCPCDHPPKWSLTFGDKLYDGPIPDTLRAPRR